MTEMADRYRRRADAFATLIDGVAPERWSNPSPCAGWVARDVVAHVVDYSGQVLRERAGVPEAEVPPFAATDVDDPAAAFRRVRRIIERLLDDPETSRKVATYLEWSLGFDLPQHGWDLAVATGQDATMDPAEVELLWDSVTGAPQQWDWQRANGWYAPPVAVPEDAPLQDRVLGLLGRDPAWRPS